MENPPRVRGEGDRAKARWRGISRVCEHPSTSASRGPLPGNAGEDENGFTLVELMVVIVIIGLLATVVIINVLPATDKAAVTKAKADVATLEQGVEMYRLNKLRYPSAAEGLQAVSARRLCQAAAQGPVGQCLCLRGAGPRRPRSSTSTATGPTAAKGAKARMRTSATGI